MDEALIEKGINMPWKLTLHEAAIFMIQTGAEEMEVGMRLQSGKMFRMKVTIEESDSRE